MHHTRAFLVASATLLVLGACDIPTEPPILQERWIIPVDETSLSVNELLPSGVTVSGSNFKVSVDPVSAGESLENLCPSCTPLNGFTVPVPEFSGTFQASQGLPSDVVSAAIAGGSISLAIDNGLSFDPLAGGGSLTITITAGVGGDTLGVLVLNEPLTPGEVKLDSLLLEAGMINGSLAATADIVSPGGEVATIDTSDRIDITATVDSILVSEITVNVPDQSVTLDPVDLDSDDLPSEIVDRIEQGSVILDVVNPFAVSLAGDLQIGATSKSFAVDGSPESNVEVTYTGDELRSFLGQAGVTVTGSGTANGTAVTIRPNQEMILEATLDFTIEIG